jgi:parallel beta-helix repeat protein
MTDLKLNHSLLFCIIAVILFQGAEAATVTWNLNSKFGGITQPGIARAIAEAKAHFVKEPNDTIVLEFDAGTYPLASPSNGDKGIIKLSGVNPGPEGRLVFRGAGMEKTKLVFDPEAHQIFGRDVHRVSFIGFHMTRKDYTVSQGHVLEVAPGRIDLEIQSGFPTPADIFNHESDQGRFLCRYTDSKTDPQIILENNAQIAWKSANLVSGRRWRLNLKKPDQVADYKPGDLVGIKSKNGGQTYWLSGGSDFVFEDVKWTQVSRGVFRDGFDKVRITRCIVERAPAIDGQSPCLSTPDGGPQIGQPRSTPTSGNLVEDCSMTATGDDSVAFFNSSGTIRNCHISDSFARGILLNNSPDAKLENNTLIRCPVSHVGESASGAK